jgi:putative transposase
MARKRFSPEQIITMLREAEVLLNQATPVTEVCRKLGISEQTYYRWRKEYGGMRVDQAKRLKELETLHRAREPVGKRLPDGNKSVNKHCVYGIIKQI